MSHARLWLSQVVFGNVGVFDSCHSDQQASLFYNEDLLPPKDFSWIVGLQKWFPEYRTTIHQKTAQQHITRKVNKHLVGNGSGSSNGLKYRLYTLPFPMIGRDDIKAYCHGLHCLP